MLPRRSLCNIGRECGGEGEEEKPAGRAGGARCHPNAEQEEKEEAELVRESARATFYGKISSEWQDLYLGLVLCAQHREKKHHLLNNIRTLNHYARAMLIP